MTTQNTKTTKTWRSKYTDQKKLNTLCDIVLDKIENLYEYFDVRWSRGAKVVFSSCFVHGGDNRSALNLYYNADFRVHFKCRTRGCEEHFGTSILSLVRGGLSHIKHDWKSPGDNEVTLDDTIDFLLNRFELSFSDLKEGEEYSTDHQDFCRIVNKTAAREAPTGLIDMAFYRDKVDIPAHYYLQRGYSIEVLDDYSVGTCKTYGKPMYNRAMVPILTEDGEKILGFTGRSIFEQCAKCKQWHNPEKDCYFFPKWLHSKGFEGERVLYNYWSAIQHIQDSGVVILVESPGNVWRLEESGIHNSVAIFGTTLNDDQKQLIDESGAFSIIVLMDNDEAGRVAAKKINEQCCKIYRMYFPTITTGDVAELSVDSVTSDIKPWIDQAKEKYL